MGVTVVRVLKIKARITLYSANNKENKKCFNLINIILKL